MLEHLIKPWENIPEILTKNIFNIIVEEFKNQILKAEQEQNEEVKNFYSLFVNDKEELKIFFNLFKTQQIEIGNYINVEFLSENLGDNSPVRKQRTASLRITVYSRADFEDNESVEEGQEIAHITCLRMLKLIEKIIDYQSNLTLGFERGVIKRINRVDSLDIYHNPEITSGDNYVAGSITINAEYEEAKIRLVGDPVTCISTSIIDKYKIKQVKEI